MIVTPTVLPLSEVVRPTRPKVKPSDYDGLPFVGLEHVEAHTTRLLGTVPASTVKSNAVHFQPGDVLYSRLRPYLNKVALADFEGLCSSEFIVLPENEQIIGAYLKYLLNSWDFVQFANSLNTGDRPRVDYKQISTFPVYLPSIDEQKEIVAAIETQLARLDDAVAALQRSRTRLKRYRASVLKAACEGRLVPTEAELARQEGRSYEPASVLLERIKAERKAAPGRKRGKAINTAPVDVLDLPALAEGWAWTTLDHVTSIQGGIQKQPKRAPKGNAFPFLRVANVLRGRLDLGELHQIELFADELEKLRLESGDLLIVEGNGSPDQIGRMAIWNGAVHNCVHQNHIIRARTEQAALPAYIEAFWNSPTGMQLVRSVAASTSGLYTLSVSKVSKIPVPIPPFAEQQRIVEEVERRLSVIDQMEGTIETNLKRAESLRQSILRMAFTGKLVNWKGGAA